MSNPESAFNRLNRDIQKDNIKMANIHGLGQATLGIIFGTGAVLGIQADKSVIATIIYSFGSLLCIANSVIFFRHKRTLNQQLRKM